MTSLSRCLGRDASVADLRAPVVERFAAVFGRDFSAGTAA